MAWNQPTSSEQQTNRTKCRSSPIVKGWAALVVVLVIGSFAWWLVTGKGDSATETVGKPSKVAKIAETTPAVRPTEEKTEERLVVAAHKPPPALKTYRDERGILRYEGGLRVPGQRPLAEPIQLGSHLPPRFRHSAEEHISWLLEMKIGEPVVGDYRYGDQFRRSFVESLAEPVEVLDTDDEYTRQLKADVEITKKELKSRMDAGEDVAAIMNDTMDEYRRLGAYKHDLQVMLAEIGNDPEKFTPQDVEDFVKAANEMLKKNGLPPMKMPRTIMRGLRK